MRRWVHFGGGASGASVTFTDSSVDPNNLTTYTFSAQALGTAAADRKIVIGIIGHTSAVNSGVASVTVAGSSASEVVESIITQDSTVAIWQVALAAGTTGDIVITFDNAFTRCGIGVWAVYGAGAAAHDTGSSTANPPSDTLNIPASGVALGCVTGGNSVTWTWTNLTENYDEAVEGTVTQSGASAAFAAIQTGLAITATPSGDPGSSRNMVIASWGPA